MRGGLISRKGKEHSRNAGKSVWQDTGGTGVVRVRTLVHLQGYKDIPVDTTPICPSQHHRVQDKLQHFFSRTEQMTDWLEIFQAIPSSVRYEQKS